MTELLHITERALWETAREMGSYEVSTRGYSLDEIGFIHCSLQHQLPGVAEVLYGSWTGQPDELVVLVVDSERLTVPVRFEPPVPGSPEEFPHIYGPLPVGAVVAVEPWEGWEDRHAQQGAEDAEGTEGAAPGAAPDGEADRAAGPEGAGGPTAAVS